MERRQAVAVGVLVVALGAFAIWWTAWPRGGPSRFCRALGARVDGLDSFEWSNDDTAVEATWAPVLSDGVVHAARRERPRLAAAVRRDDEGYRRMLDHSPAALRPALRRMHALVLDPDRSWEHRHDRAVDRDWGTVLRADAHLCNRA